VRGVDITPANYAIVERLAHWQAALNMADAHPWLGVGFGNYEIAYDSYRLLNWRESLGHAHNYYLNLLAETGIIGTSAYVALWIGVIGLTLRALRHPDTLARLTAAGLLGTWTYLLLHSLTDNVYVNNLFLHLGIMLGILANIIDQTRWSARSQTR
jgi:O-antigen ligase